MIALKEVSIKNFVKNAFWGGASIYKQYLPRADRMYLTTIEGDFGGDAFFSRI